MAIEDVIMPELTLHDRCDSCNAQAYYRVTLESLSELCFCGHHWRKHEEAIRPLARFVQDGSDKLAKL